MKPADLRLLFGLWMSSSVCAQFMSPAQPITGTSITKRPSITLTQSLLEVHHRTAFTCELLLGALPMLQADCAEHTCDDDGLPGEETCQVCSERDVPTPQASQLRF